MTLCPVCEHDVRNHDVVEGGCLVGWSFDRLGCPCTRTFPVNLEEARMSNVFPLTPRDHGSDRYDYVEVEAPPGIRPIGQWWDNLIATPCEECRANVFARYVNGPPELPPAWAIAIAHDDTCPYADSLGVRRP
jgi:hypothetical protein